MQDMVRVVRWCILGGVGLLMLAPLVVVPTLFFPFVTGKNFFVRIIIDVIFGLYVALTILDARYRPVWSRIALALGAFVGALTLATVFGVNSYNSFWSNYERMEGLITILHVVALFFVVAHTVRGRDEWRALIGISLGTSVLSAAYGFLQAVGAVAIVGEGRPAAGFGNSIYLSVYLMFHMMVLAYLALVKRGPMQWAYAALGAFLLFVFFASGSRGAFLGFIAALGVVLLWGALAASTVRIRNMLAGGVAVGVLAFVLMFTFSDSGFVRSIPLLSRFFSTDVLALGSDSRVLIWKIGLEGFTHKPLFGWGPGNFIVPFSLYYNSALFTAEPWFDRTHNMFVEWLVTAGVVGFLAYVSIFLAWGLTIRSLLRTGTIARPEAMILSALAIAYGVQNMFVFDNITTYLFVVMLSAYLVSRESVVQSGSSGAMGNSGVRVGLASGAVVVGVVCAIMFNAKPLVVSADLISSLNTFGQNKTATQIEEQFASTIALGTFGRTEVRERLADTMVNLSTKGEVSEQYIQLLDYAIREYEKELVEREPTLRSIIFAGKLNTIRYVVSKQESSRARAYELYQRAIEISPNYIQGRLGLAEIALASKDFITAKEQARISYEKVENKDGIFYPAVSVYLVADDAVSANAMLQLYTDPKIFNGFDESKSIQVISRALSVLSPTERLGFLETYEKAWRDYGPHGIIYLALAQTYGELGRLAEAEQMANRAALLTPSYAPQVEQFLKAIHGAR